MNSNSRLIFTVTLAIAAFVLPPSGQSFAQTLGYLYSNPIQAFDASTGQVVNSFTITNLQGSFALTKGGNTLLAPVEPDRLALVSVSTGKVISEVKKIFLPEVAKAKTIVSPSGGYAFVMGWAGGDRVANATAIVNLKKQEVVGYIVVDGGAPVDIAIAPDGKQFFISTRSLGGLDWGSTQGLDEPNESFSTTAPVYKCTQVPGVCVFSTPTFAVVANIFLTAGFLTLSQDGNSLYSFPDQGEGFPLSAVNTTSFAVSQVDLGSLTSINSVTIAPSGNQAIITGNTGNAYSSLVLDTQTNTVSGTFPLPPIGGNPGVGSDAAAFSPDGSILWTLSGCPNCNILVGQSFPSGDVVAQTTLTTAAGEIIF